MRKHGGAVRKKLGKTWKERGGRRPPRPPNRREQERNQQDRGRARKKRRWTREGTSKAGNGPLKHHEEKRE